MTVKKTNQQFTLEQITEMLNSLNPTDHQRILQVVKTVTPQFEEFLKARPYSTKEANELFEVYLQIRYWSKKIDPNNEENEYWKNWLGLQMQVAGLSAKEWLRGMYDCLREVREYLQVNEIIKEGKLIEIEEIILYLKQGDFFIEEEEGKTFVHLDEDQYNEFGIELREDCFKVIF
ncbi:MAG: hypothetical protein HZR80_05130 [Candidatus Heimdallarchaeota archaeon]